MSLPAGWYPDPSTPGLQRWWDGQTWTAAVQALPLPQPVWQGGWMPPPVGSGAGGQRQPHRPAVVATVVAVALMMLAGTGTIVGLVVHQSDHAPSSTHQTLPADSPSPSTSLSPAETPKPTVSKAAVPARPVVGQCHFYTLDDTDALTSPTAPVSCARPHTALTVAVIEPPTETSLPLARTDNDGIDRADRACFDEVWHYLKARPGVFYSQLDEVFFTPSGTQLTAGQRWIRCDLVSYAVDPDGIESLALLQPAAQLQGKLKDGVPLSLASCGVRTPTTDDDNYASALCTAPDAFVLIAVARGTPAGGAWPGEKVAQQRATAACTKFAASFSNLKLQGLPAVKSDWRTSALCVADTAAYEGWLRAGGHFTDRG